MSEDGPRPSRAIACLLRRVSSAASADAAVGDILEDLNQRQTAGHAPRWPALWIDRQVFWAVMAAAAAAAPRVLRSFGHALRDAARALRRAPAHALFILVILAVGVSAATVTFSVVDAVVLRPLPFDGSKELVNVGLRSLRGSAALTPQEFWAIHDRVSGFESVGVRFIYATRSRAASTWDGWQRAARRRARPSAAWAFN